MVSNILVGIFTYISIFIVADWLTMVIGKFSIETFDMLIIALAIFFLINIYAVGVR